MWFDGQVETKVRPSRVFHQSIMTVLEWRKTEELQTQFIIIVPIVIIIIYARESFRKTC